MLRRTTVEDFIDALRDFQTYALCWRHLLGAWSRRQQRRRRRSRRSFRPR